MARAPSEAVRKFRARFAGIAAEERAAAPTTAEQRLKLAIELHGFNLLLELDRIRCQAGKDESEVIDELNRRRLASPMPRSLRERARDGHPRSR